MNIKTFSQSVSISFCSHYCNSVKTFYTQHLSLQTSQMFWIYIIQYALQPKLFCVKQIITRNCFIWCWLFGNSCQTVYLDELELLELFNLGLSQSWNMQKLNQNGYQRGGYSSAVAKQLHASKSVEFKLWKGSKFPVDWFQHRAYLRGALDIRAEACQNSVQCWCACVCVCSHM